MTATFDLLNNSVAVTCNYKWQFEQAILQYDPFQQYERNTKLP